MLKKRSIWYWGRAAEEIVLILLAIGFFYGIFFQVMDRSFSVQEVLDSISTNVVVWTTMMVFVFQMTGLGKHFPMVLSFGSCRREAFLGSQLMNGLLYVQCLAIVILFGSLRSTGSRGWFFYAMYSLVYILVNAISQLVTAIWMKCGKGKLMIVIMVILSLIGFVVIGLFVAIGTIGIYDKLESAKLIGTVGGLAVAKLIGAVGGHAVAITVYALSAVSVRRMMENYEVRA